MNKLQPLHEFQLNRLNSLEKLNEVNPSKSMLATIKTGLNDNEKTERRH